MISYYNGRPTPGKHLKRLGSDNWFNSVEDEDLASSCAGRQSDLVYLVTSNRLSDKISHPLVEGTQ